MAHILKPTYVNEAQKAALIQRVESDRQSLNGSADALREIGFNILSVEALKAVTEESVSKQVENGLEAAKKAFGGSFIPKAVLADLTTTYNDIKAKAAPQAGHIADMVAKYSDIEIKMDSKGHFWFDKKQVEEQATETATHEYTQTQREYYSRLFDVADALNALFRYENEHNLNRYSKGEPSKLLPKGMGLTVESIEQLLFVAEQSAFKLTEERFRYALIRGLICVDKQTEERILMSEDFTAAQGAERATKRREAEAAAAAAQKAKDIAFRKKLQATI